MSMFRVCGLKWGPIWKLPIHTTKAGASKLLQIMSMFAQEIEEAETVARVIKHEGGRARPCNAAKPLVGAAPPLGCICGAEQTGDRKKSKKHQRGEGPEKPPDISFTDKKSKAQRG